MKNAKQYRHVLPWLCFALAIAYGAWQTHRHAETLDAQTRWVKAVTAYISEQEAADWKRIDQAKYLIWMKAQNPNIRFPDEAEIPAMVFGEVPAIQDLTPR